VGLRIVPFKFYSDLIVLSFGGLSGRCFVFSAQFAGLVIRLPRAFCEVPVRFAAKFDFFGLARGSIFGARIFAFF